MTRRVDPAADNDEVLRLVADTCREVASGNFEARLPFIGDSAHAQDARNELNALLDITDAFVRESGRR